MQSLRIIQDLFLLWLVFGDCYVWFFFFWNTSNQIFQLLRHTFTVTLTYWHTKNKAIIRRKLLVFEMQKLKAIGTSTKMVPVKLCFIVHQ